MFRMEATDASATTNYTVH